MNLKWKAIFLGQFLSFVITGTGICSQTLSEKLGVSMPMTQNLMNYILLSIVFIPVNIIYSSSKKPKKQKKKEKKKKEQKKQTKNNNFIINYIRRKEKIFFYLMLVVSDVEANYFVVKAYKYTTIANVMLLDCFTIPCVMILSYIFLKNRYKFSHLIGVILSIFGIVILVWNDLIYGDNNSNDNNHTHKMLGDFLCLLASLFYSISNVCVEKLMKTGTSKVEYLSHVGFLGTIVCSVQILCLERKEFLDLDIFTFKVIGFILLYSFCMFLLYSFVPTMISWGGATLYNLSLMTSDFYSVIVAVYLFNQNMSFLYFLSFFVICSGIFVYNLKDGYQKNQQNQKFVKDYYLNNDESENREKDYLLNNKRVIDL